MEFTIEEEFDYTPGWNGNNKSDNPMVWHLKALNNKDVDKCIKARMIDGKFEMTTNESEVIRAGVKSIDNFKLNGKDITTAKDALEAKGISALISEVSGVLLCKAAVPDLKN